MPQMSPMNWDFLFLGFLLLFIASFTKIYPMSEKSPNPQCQVGNSVLKSHTSLGW